MRTLVIYDISDDRIRNAVAEVCKDFGLSRIQRSAFLGLLPSGKRKDLIEKLSRVLGESAGNIQIFVICNADLSLRTIIGIEYYEEEGADIVI
ncbi:MAG: CRISPR-associated endonuclease Cas2 [Thaumarchaeota archaeon]|nr:CRISPR-associated endonuclease Cas2 [Candidatus Calditenuaceae archaeon]